MKYDVLITAVSWEQRFLASCDRILSMHDISRIIALHSAEYADRTETARGAISAKCNELTIALDQFTFFGTDPRRTWNEALAVSVGTVQEESKVLVDISTMPREIIWQVFWFLQLRQCSIDYVYSRPASYGQWLSRDPDRPRLVLKMSGISRIGQRTALLVLAGYDVDRVRHLIEVFEPSITRLGLQANSIDPQNPARMEEQARAFDKDSSVSTFSVDAYSADHGRSAIEEAVQEVLVDHNVVMASLGPKLSAIPLYNLQRKLESPGLVYLPSREFNTEYSTGLGDSIWGSLTSDDQPA